VKLVVAIVHSEDAGGLVEALLRKDFRATRLQSSGGFLKESNATILIGVDDDQVETVLGIHRERCTARQRTVNPTPPIMEPGLSSAGSIRSTSVRLTRARMVRTGSGEMPIP